MIRLLPSFVVSLSLAMSACSAKPLPSQPMGTAFTEKTALKDHAALKSLILIAIIIAISLLSACTVFRPNSSWSEELTEADRDTVAEIVKRLANVQAEQSIYIRPPVQEGDGLKKALEATFLKSNYQVEQEDSETAGTVHLRYRLTKYADGYLLRVNVGDREVSTVLRRQADGGLNVSEPLSIRENSK